MLKINNKSIILGFKILTILAFGIMLMPTSSSAVTCGEGGCNTIYNTYTRPATVIEDNPKPEIDSITPERSSVGTGTKTITIIGEGFVSSSVARINGSNRPTTFVDRSHLLMQITGSDTFKFHTNGGFFITVYNSAPGGGYSNAKFFTLAGPAPSGAGATANPETDTSTNFTDLETGEVRGEYSDLVSNAIFGANGILPSGIIQWMFVAVLVLLMVILVRRAYGADKKYHAAPLKHD